MNSKNAEDTTFRAGGYPASLDRREAAADTRAFLTQEFPTHGKRLVHMARSIISRRIPVFPWLQPLETTIEHLASLPVPAQERFQRIEIQPHGVSFPQQPGAEVTHWSMGGSSRTSHPDGASLQAYSRSFIPGLPIVAQSEVLVEKRPLPATFQPMSSSMPTSNSALSVMEQGKTSGEGWSFPDSIKQQVHGLVGPEVEAIRIHDDATFQPGSSLPISNQGLSTQEQGKMSGEGWPLPASIKQQLHSFVGLGVETIRIHDDAESDALAQVSQADAVTMGSHVFFRQGRFRPQEDEGFALLTHEALHVVRAMQPGAAWRRATQAGIQEEEREASTLERQALHSRRDMTGRDHFLSASFQASTPVTPALPLHMTSQTANATIASSPAQQPMRASTNRVLENGERTQSMPTAMPDMDELKRTLYRDLIRQIKADLERGG